MTVPYRIFVIWNRVVAVREDIRQDTTIGTTLFIEGGHELWIELEYDEAVRRVQLAQKLEPTPLQTNEKR